MDTSLALLLKELKEEEALALTRELLASGTTPQEILAQCQDGMTQVGRLFEAGDFFLGELIYSGAIFKRISGLLEEAAAGSSKPATSDRKVVVGTIQGDVHDLGKSIVVMLLASAGYEVIDLGVDVPPEKFIEAVKDSSARVVGLSALLTTSFAGMKKVVELLSENGLREMTKVIIGGGVVDQQSLDYVGADSFSRNAYEAVSFCDRVYQ